MGYMRHHAVVVTTYRDDLMSAAHAKAVEIFNADMVTGVTPAMMNGWRSFLVAPDGSKEGWTLSDECDERRSQFIAWLKQQAYDDGSSSLQWVEVQFGDDMQEAKVTDSYDDHYSKVERMREAGQ